RRIREAAQEPHPYGAQKLPGRRVSGAAESVRKDAPASQEVDRGDRRHFPSRAPDRVRFPRSVTARAISGAVRALPAAMYTNPNIKYRPSLIEENPALLILILVLGVYAVLVVIAKYAWYITDKQLVEFTL